jgi:hypothetical protein
VTIIDWWTGIVTVVNGNRVNDGNLNPSSRKREIIQKVELCVNPQLFEQRNFFFCS